MPLCHYIAKSGRKRWQHSVILTLACMLVTIVNIKNKQFGVVPSCSVGSSHLFFLFLFFGYVEPKSFFLYPVQPLPTDSPPNSLSNIFFTFQWCRHFCWMAPYILISLLNSKSDVLAMIVQMLANPNHWSNSIPPFCCSHIIVRINQFTCHSNEKIIFLHFCWPFYI